jgi:hypothetical protein
MNPDIKVYERPLWFSIKNGKYIKKMIKVGKPTNFTFFMVGFYLE